MNARRLVARVGVALAALLVACSGGVARAEVGAQATSTAVVIVDTGSGTRQSVIHFDGAVSGLGALQLAGADPVTIAFGTLGQAVCQLYGVGDAPVPSQCPGGWTYFRAVGGAGGWTQSGAGASNTLVHDGDVEGWKYGGGQPPFASYCSVVGCAPPPAEPPPVVAAPSGPSTGGAPAGSGNAAPGAAAGDGSPSGPVTSGGAASTTGPAGASTTVPDVRANGSRGGGETRRRAHDVVAAGPGVGGGDSGSPVGVIIAAVVLTAGVVGAVWARRRRRGTAPG
jgi:hypothetical protein